VSGDGSGKLFAGVHAFYYLLPAQDRVYFSSRCAANRRQRRVVAWQKMEYCTVEMLTSSKLVRHCQGYLLAAASFIKFKQAVNCTRYIVSSPLERGIVRSCPKNFHDFIDFFFMYILMNLSERNWFFQKKIDTFFYVYVMYQSCFTIFFFGVKIIRQISCICRM